MKNPPGRGFPSRLVLKIHEINLNRVLRKLKRIPLPPLLLFQIFDMTRHVFLLACALILLPSPLALAKVVKYYFNVQTSNFERLCHRETITTVSGQLPGPAVVANEGDTLVIRVVNSSPYNITIHWHGVKQLFSAWADGPEYVTQCPIQPGQSYTHNFKITGQEGTLFWHAHARWLRATVYGAIIIRPKPGSSYPFRTPFREVPIVLGEWWNANIIDIEDATIGSGGAPKVSDALLINGQPGDLYPCSKNSTFKLSVIQGKTYLLRIINAALDTQLFFKIADHKLTVVGIDATYTVPKETDVIFLSPGQTVDALLTADQKPSSYYMAARAYKSAPSTTVDMTTATGIIAYSNCKSSIPKMPNLPPYDDTQTVHQFSSSLLGLVNGPHWTPVPLQVDEHMFMTVNLGLFFCGGNSTCLGPLGMRLGASLTNESFVTPTKLSMLEAFYNKVGGIYTTDFPDQPPVTFDYTSKINSANPALIFPSKSTKVKKLKFNSTVEIVMQNTALLEAENHPMHLHGFDFHVLGYGFGNYNMETANLNTVNPQVHNTVSVPVGGWTVFRFQANNPGIWLMHCHLDLHVPWGMAMAFEVENGPTPETSLPPPPADLPQC